MFEWMTAMLEHAKAFFALSGGLGILEEICHIFSWAQLNIH
jgi:predicted Rossmann-fold nucleotide-binding protein